MWGKMLRKTAVKKKKILKQKIANPSGELGMSKTF